MLQFFLVLFLLLTNPTSVIYTKRADKYFLVGNLRNEFAGSYYKGLDSVFGAMALGPPLFTMTLS